MNPTDRHHDPRINTRFRLRHLELFERVSELGTLRQAAQACSMTQPAATRLIKELEDMLGASLFVRDRRGMKLTAEGGLVRRHMGILTADFENLRAELRLFAGGATGRIRLGIIPSLSSVLLADSIAATLALRPRVQMTLTEGATTPLLAALARNELDLIFGRVLDSAQATELKVSNVYTETFAIACAWHRQDKGRRKLGWPELSRARWVLPAAGTPMREMAENLFIQNGALRPDVAVECSSFHQMRVLIARSDLFGLIPHSIALQGRALKELRILMPDHPIRFAPISLVTRKDFEPSPLVGEFIRTVCATASAMGL